MHSWKIFGGIWCYEFLMQIRRPALWLAFLLFAVIGTRTVVGQVSFYRTDFFTHYSALEWAAFLAVITNWLAPLGVGILLADRLPRDRRLRVEEVLDSLPATLKMRVLGKYLGTLLASLVPSFLLYLLDTAFAAWQLSNWALLPSALLCYVLIVLPGMCFIAAFSVALPRVIWVPLYQFLFFGYWFWGNILAPGYGIPTLSGTILAPIGSPIADGLFGITTFGQEPASVMYAVSSIVVMFGVAVLVLIALYQFLKLERARQ